MHIAYPNIDPDTSPPVFRACVRYVSQADVPGEPYETARPNTPNGSAIREGVRRLVPAWSDATLAVELYEKVDAPGTYRGPSQDLAYFLALIRCVQRLVLDGLKDVGDLWCTGVIELPDHTPVLRQVQGPEFWAKLAGFLSQAPQDRIFLVPEANIYQAEARLCRDQGVPVLTLEAFQPRLAAALAAGVWRDKVVVRVHYDQLPHLVELLFARPPASHGHREAVLPPRRPYKGLAALPKILAALDRSSCSARRLIPWGIGALAVAAVAWMASPYYFDDGRLSMHITPDQNVVASLSGLGAPQPLPRGPHETQTPPDRVVTYHYTREGTGFRIRYDLPYLHRVHQTGEIEGITYDTSPFEAPLPALHVTVTNNTRRPVVITAAVLTIKTSDVPEEVIPIIDDMSQSNLIITNQGWAEVIDPILTISVSEVEGTFSLFAEERHTVKLEPFSHIKQVPIRDFVPERLRGMGLVKVSGALEYGRPGARQSVQYTTRVLQRILAERVPELSVPYNAFFRAGESGKPVVVDLQPPKPIKPGETEVFLIRLRSDKSSTTLMQVDFQTIEGQTIRGNEFKIDMFVPRDLRAAWKQEQIGSSQ